MEVATGSSFLSITDPQIGQTFNSISLDIFRFRATTMPQIKGNRQGVPNWQTLEGNRVNWVFDRTLISGWYSQDDHNTMTHNAIYCVQTQTFSFSGSLMSPNEFPILMNGMFGAKTNCSFFLAHALNCK